MLGRRFKSSSSSKRWLERQQNDLFSRQSKTLGYKSRAAFKLIEINDKYRIFNRKASNIVDLGCSPGSWTQVALQQAQKHHNTPKILGIDLIKCSLPKGATFIQGDFLTPEIHRRIMQHFDHKPIDLVLSDMMTNATGLGNIDHLASMDLCHSVTHLAHSLLAKNGTLVMKFFMGQEQSIVASELQKMFHKVYTFKPQSSRDELREMYFVALKKLSVPEENVP